MARSILTIGFAYLNLTGTAGQDDNFVKSPEQTVANIALTKAKP